MWFLLTALAGEGEALVEHAGVFAAEFANARVVDPGPIGAAPSLRCVFIVVAGGDLAGAVRGGREATAAVLTAKALVDRLYMFSPGLVAEPGGWQSA